MYTGKVGVAVPLSFYSYSEIVEFLPGWDSGFLGLSQDTTFRHTTTASVRVTIHEDHSISIHGVQLSEGTVVLMFNLLSTMP
jgi:hypothetical protein